MDFELKSISVHGIPEALAKVERYRLLNEPFLAESICPRHSSDRARSPAGANFPLLATDQFHSNMQAKAASGSSRSNSGGL